MDQVDIDLTVDVPSISVRLATRETNRHSNYSDVTDENRCTSTPCRSGQQRLVGKGAKDQPTVIDSGRRGASGLSQRFSGSSSNSQYPVTSSALSMARSSENARLLHKGATEKKLCPQNNDSASTQILQSGRSLCNSKSSSRDDHFINRKALTYGQLKNNQYDSRRRSGLPSLASSSHALSNANQTDNTKKVGTSVDSSEVGTIQNESSSDGFLLSKQKRLVRNGCISPNNIAKGKQLAGKYVNGSANVSGSMASGEPSSVDIMELVAEDNDSHTRKGKEVVNHPCTSKGRHDFRNKNLLGDSFSFNEKAAETGDSIRHAGKSYDESDGWRRKNNQTAEMNISLSSDKKRHLGGETSGPRCSSQHQDNMSHPRVRLGLLNGTRSAAKAHIKRQKLGSTSGSHGESSTSVSNDSEVAHLSSSAEAANPKSASSSVGNLRRIVEVDELTPQLRCISRDEDARARQVEADELLARELQAQFYSELPAFAVGEVDEHTLQQQANTNRGFSEARIPVLNARGSYRSSSNIPHSRGSRARRSTLRRTSLRNRFPGQPRTLMPSTGRTSLFPDDMDVDTRMHILGALEEISDMRMTTAILQARRDFNENDYEMLLALDDNNRNNGASIHQINGLPESTVQSDNFQEVCAICLDTPTIGDTIRHLPCLHKFHKDCIGPWLQRKTSCPVCKCSIT